MDKLRHSRRVRGLLPDFIPGSGENPMEAIDQGVATTSQVGDNVVAESGVPYSSHLRPLVQQPSWGDSLFHSPMEGRVDDTSHLNFGPNAPFWDTPVLGLLILPCPNLVICLNQESCLNRESIQSIYSH